MKSASYLDFIVRNAYSVCVLMDQGRIKVKCASVIINVCSLEREISEENDGARLLTLGCHGEGVPAPSPWLFFFLVGQGWVF